MADPRDLYEPFRSACEKAGFDVVHGFDVSAYNAKVDPPLRLHRFERKAPVGFLVGNTKALWEVFLRALEAEPSRREDEHPLDGYAKAHITRAADTLNAPHVILWADDVGPSAAPVQRIAHATGLAWLSPSHLSVHPVYGPWFAFRAVVLVDRDGDGFGRSIPPDPCSACHKPCMAALDTAVSKSETLDHSAVSEHFELWRRVRDVCPEGAPHRYDEAQLRYHYTKDKELLRLRPRDDERPTRLLPPNS